MGKKVAEDIFIEPKPPRKLLCRRWEGNEGAPALFLLHDALGSIPQWKSFPSLLSSQTGFAVMACDRLGHGQSDPPIHKQSSDYLQVEAREMLPAILQALHLLNTVLIGHSDGATIALLYAAFYQPPAVVAIAPHCFVEAVTLAGIENTLENKTRLLQKLAVYHNRRAPGLFNRWVKTWLDPAFRSWDIRPLLKNIHCPVLLIQDQEDPYGSPAQLSEIAREVQGSCTICFLENAGHAPHLTNPGKVVGMIGEFLKQVDYYR